MRGKTDLDPLIQSLVDTHPQPFALVDRDYTIVACNRKYAEAYTHLAPGEIVGMKCHEVSHKSGNKCEINGEECPLDRVLESASAVQVIHRHFDRHHEPYYVAIHGAPIGSGDGVRYMGESMCPISKGCELEFDESRMVGCCPSFMTMLDNLVVVAESDLPVLIHGETGTGKEMAAKLIHRKSRRAEGPYITVDCTSLSGEMFANELFGHEVGAYTGSVGVKKGLVELAHGGTLFLDEIGEISAEVQAKLLRVLDSGTFRRLGGNEERRVDFRLVSATNRDLKAMVQSGAFRADLYFRINSMQVDLPPLRHRISDIPELVKHFLSKLLPEHPGSAITPEALEQLRHYAYPGNMRELKHILERAVLMSRHGRIELAHLPPEVRQADPAKVHADAAEHFCDCAEGDSPEAIRHALKLARGNRKRAAAFLKVSERTLYRRIKQYGLSDG